MKKNEEESLNKIISQYKNNKIENLYKNKKDFYPFNYEEKKPNKIPHEKLRKNSKKRVLNNFMNAMIFPFEEQRYLIDNNKNNNNYNNNINNNQIKGNNTFREIIGQRNINLKFDKNDFNENKNFKVNKSNKIIQSRLIKENKKYCKSKEEFLKNNNDIFYEKLNYANKYKVNENSKKNTIIKTSNLNTYENENTLLKEKINYSKEEILTKRKEDWKKLYEYFKNK